MTLARSADARGDLPGALAAFTKAAALLQGAVSGVSAVGVDGNVKRKGEEAVRAFMDGEEGREMERAKKDVERRLGTMISAQQQQCVYYIYNGYITLLNNIMQTNQGGNCIDSQRREHR